MFDSQIGPIVYARVTDSLIRRKQQRKAEYIVKQCVQIFCWLHNHLMVM
jgi:hypothetical protein